MTECLKVRDLKIDGQGCLDLLKFDKFGLEPTILKFHVRNLMKIMNNLRNSRA